ncbi:glycosyltransferase family 2 protein [Enterococcus faecalis]
MISVCMATYNGERYLASQLDSILCQLNSDDELIVSDDGSVDQTLSILKKYAAQFPQMHIMKGPGRGVIANFEKAIEQAQGEIIFLADQDDVWLPNKVATTCAAFASSPSTQVIVSDLMIVDQQLQVLEPSFFRYRKAKTGVGHNLLKNGYIGAGMAFKKQLKSLVLPIPTNVPMHDMWIGLLGELAGGNQLLWQPLTLYRRHDQNVSEIRTNASRWQQLNWRLTLLFLLIKRKMRRKSKRNNFTVL